MRTATHLRPGILPQRSPIAVQQAQWTDSSHRWPALHANAHTGKKWPWSTDAVVTDVAPSTCAQCANRGRFVVEHSGAPCTPRTLILTGIVGIADPRWCFSTVQTRGHLCGSLKTEPRTLWSRGQRAPHNCMHGLRRRETEMLGSR